MRRRESGWPIPPPAPRTVTLVLRAAEEENWRTEETWRAALRANMVNVEEGEEENVDGDGDGDEERRRERCRDRHA